VNKFDQMTDLVLSCVLGILVFVVLLAVLFRYALDNSLVWSDEFVRYLFVWLTMIGAAVVLREREHIRIEYFVDKLPGPLRGIIEAVMMAGVGLLQLAFAVLGFFWVWSTQGSFTSALQWPLNIVFYAALPCSAVLATLYSLRRLRHGAFTEKGSSEADVMPQDERGESP
jgi:TRAP-type C4-dicarboxylate transport system permease small subunit